MILINQRIGRFRPYKYGKLLNYVSANFALLADSAYPSAPGTNHSRVQYMFAFTGQRWAPRINKVSHINLNYLLANA